MKRAFRAMSWVLALFPFAALADCMVTLPSSSPVDVPGMKSDGKYAAWYGSEALAVLLPAQGRWKGMGPERNYRDKFWIWRRGYNAMGEGRPALTLTGVKLHDGETTERLKIDNATNAFGNGWHSMLTMLEFPDAGCWQVTVSYVYIGITHELTFVIDVVDD
jgi:hypothetical protein